MRQSHSEPRGAGYVLVLNAGSSSLKFEAYERDPSWRALLRGGVRDIGRPAPVLEWSGRADERLEHVDAHAAAAALVMDRLEQGPAQSSAGPPALTAHRVVHGGEVYTAPQLVTAEVRERLEALTPLAPLHNPPALAVMDAVGERFPGVPMVAVFDTAFFSELPEHVRRYAVPEAWHERERIQRYGFHGIAHRYLRDRLAELRGNAELPARVVTLHLGQGCSITALRDGVPVETSMGLTPNEGLIMGTRSGDLDAGAVTHMARAGLSWQALDRQLNRESGLLGLSGASDDMRELVELERAGHAGARLAIEAFCHRARKYVGAYAAVLGGVDALVFGGGIGENAPSIRARICAGLEWLGLELDAGLNADNGARQPRISAAGSTIDVYVVAVREEDAIGRAGVACLEAARERADGPSVTEPDAGKELDDDG